MFDIKSYFRANKTTPTSIPASGQIVDAISDVQGRQVVYPYQVRDLTLTAYATLNSNAETTLFTSPAAVAASNSVPSATNAVFADLVMISCANTSTSAVVVDLRTGTANGIVKTIAIPASQTVVAPLLSPLPQQEAAAKWTIQFNTTWNADVSGTTVLVDALFVNNQ